MSTTFATASSPTIRPVKKKLSSASRTALLFLPPALILFTLFVVYPLGESAYYSFFQWNGYGFPTKWIHFDNYWRALENPVFQQALTNNLLVILVSALVQLPLALTLGLLIADRSRSSAVFRTIFFAPYVLAEVVAALIWRYLLDGDYGLVSVIYQSLHLEPPHPLAERGWAMAALLLVIVWKYFGFHMALFIAARQSISADVVESARIDGASPWKITRHIILPLMRPVMALSLFFSIIGSLQLFDLVLPLTEGGPLDSTQSVVSYLYTFGIKRMRLGFGSAVGVILFVVCVLTMMLYRQFLLRERRT